MLLSGTVGNKTVIPQHTLITIYIKLDSVAGYVNYMEIGNPPTNKELVESFLGCLCIFLSKFKWP